MPRSNFIEFFLALGCVAVGLVLSVLVAGSFLGAVARTLRRVAPEHRRMDPSNVWLNLIPVFNVVWAVVTVERVAESLKDEFRARGLHGPGEWYGRGYGLTTVACLVPGMWFYPAFLTFPVAVVSGLLYWRQMNRYAARLRPGAYAPPPVDEGW